MNRPRISRAPIQPTRVRTTKAQTFAFLPHRFLQHGFLTSLTRNQLALYIFLVLAADRNGLSFYGYESICNTLEITLDQYIDARNALIAKDLLAFDGRRFQVLSLPNRPVFAEAPDAADHQLVLEDPAMIRRTCLRALSSPSRWEEDQEEGTRTRKDNHSTHPKSTE